MAKVPQKKSKIASLFFKKEARGFSLLEMVMVIGVLGIISTATIPMYRKYQVSSDLNNAQALITQGISRARQLAQSGKNDDAWGFSSQYGVLYEGRNYPSRVSGKDELYAIPSTITVSGVTDVSFEKLSGKPSTNGNITLSAFDGQQRIINIAVNDAGIAMNTNDLLVICHEPGTPSAQTQYISDADLPAYLALGDTTGACPVVVASSSSSSRASSTSSSAVSSSVASSVISSVASSVASSSVSSSGGGSGGGSSAGGLSTVTKGILLMEPTAQSALNISGNGTLSIASAGVIMLNTSNPYGALISGNGVVSSPHLYTYGTPGVRVTGNGSFNTTVHTNTVPVADPLAALPVPSTTTPTISSATYAGNTVVTLSPGTYSNGIKGSSNANITLLPGTYYISAGGLNISGNASISGNGVTIYTTGGGAVSLSGNGTINLKAPTSGTYNGIVIYQNRTYSTAMTITGNGNMSITGTIYAAKSPITVTGNGVSNTVGTRIIGLTLKIAGNGGVSVQ